MIGCGFLSMVITAQENGRRHLGACCRNCLPLTCMCQYLHADADLLNGNISGLSQHLYTSRKAWRTKCDDINRRDLCPIDAGHITQMLQMREAAGGNCNGIGFDFRGPNRFNAIEDACQFKAAAAGELRSEPHASTS